MNIIFCLSYLSLFQTIFLVEKFGKDNVQIITSNHNIKKLFSLAYHENIVRFVNGSSILLPKNFIQFIIFPYRIIELIIKKRVIWCSFKNLKNNKIYFFFNAAGFFHAWLICKLSKNNQLFYHEDLNLESFKLSKTLRSKLNKWFIKKIYNEEVSPLNQGNVVNYKMTSQFLNKCNVNTVDLTYNRKKILEIISSKVDFPTGQILFLPPLIDESKINKFTYNEIIEKFISICQTKKIKIHLKRHPRSQEYSYMETKLFEIPMYYPANCLVNYKIIVGVNSATLFELANSSCISISLIKLVMNKNLIDTSIKFLDNNLEKGKKIFYPQNITELMNIILNFTDLDE